MPHGTLHCPPEIHQEQEDPLNLDQKYDIIQIENVTPSTLKGIAQQYELENARRYY